MKTIQFLTNYITKTARITIAEENGNIVYEGDAMSLPRAIIKDTVIAGIAFGSLDDIVINISQKEVEK